MFFRQQNFVHRNELLCFTRRKIKTSSWSKISVRVAVRQVNLTKMFKFDSRTPKCKHKIHDMYLFTTYLDSYSFEHLYSFFVNKSCSSISSFESWPKSRKIAPFHGYVNGKSRYVRSWIWILCLVLNPSKMVGSILTVEFYNQRLKF